MADPSEDFEKLPRPVQHCSSDSSNSDDEGEQIEHVLKDGAPEEALTPESERIVVLGHDVVRSAPASLVPNANPSWINRIKSAGASVIESIRPSSSGQDVRQAEGYEKHPKRKWKAKLWSTWNNIKYSSTWMSDRSDEYGGDEDVVFLGRKYSTSKDDSGASRGFEEFCSDYYSKIWITYRTDFAPLLGTDTTTDCGWGCMIRTTQMMTAHAIMLNRFGRDWRFVRRKKSHVAMEHGEETEFDREKLLELMILKLFEDKESAPLGIHRMVGIASSEKGKKAVGCWYSPSEAVFIMKKALSESISPFTGDTAMLGAAVLNPIYVPHLMRLFSMETCLGVTGGRPDHSSWFVGYYGDQIIYLDPHVAHEYIPIDTNPSDPIPAGKKAKKSVRNGATTAVFSPKMHFLDMDPRARSASDSSRASSSTKTCGLSTWSATSQFIDIDQGEEHGMKRVRDPLFSVVYGERRSDPHYEQTATEAEKAQADRHGFEML
ncbi:unnamed protein product [Caenorhabditis sp. 36 PRJEB53466]|nr:unnamed protein product [Caenorhabditis sp. 36 PRJEB53466]